MLWKNESSYILQDQFYLILGILFTLFRVTFSTSRVIFISNANWTVVFSSFGRKEEKTLFILMITGQVRGTQTRRSHAERQGLIRWVGYSRCVHKIGHTLLIEKENHIGTIRSQIYNFNCGLLQERSEKSRSVTPRATRRRHKDKSEGKTRKHRIKWLLCVTTQNHVLVLKIRIIKF